MGDSNLSLVDALQITAADFRRARAALAQEHETKELIVPTVINDRPTILRRLADGDTLVYSRDGDDGWFTKGDGAWVGPEIMAMRREGLIKTVSVPDEDRSFDTISEAGRDALAQKATPDAE